MSIVVTCKIIVENQEYEAGVTPGVAFEVVKFCSSTGTFDSFSRKFMEDFIEAAIDGAKEESAKKLYILKGKK